MEILVVADSHLTGRNPIARLDDLVTLQFLKWEQIVNIANKYDVPIVHAGDIFNVAIVANSLLTQLGEILNKLIHPLYFVWGNHDLQYHSAEMWNRTSLGVLWKNNDKVKHISEFWKDYSTWWAWLDWGSDEIQWYGTPPNLLLTHTAVVSPLQVGKNSWILEDKNFCINIEEENLSKRYKTIICGHWHKPYIYHYKGTKVINPGPVIRRTVDEQFMPSVVLLNLDTLIHKRIYLDTPPPEQVLSRTHIEHKVEAITDNVLQLIDSLKHKRISHKKTYIKTLFYNLDQHELPTRVEKIIRETVAILIQKGAINESV